MNQTAITQALQQLVQTPVRENADMKNFTTWKLGGPADWLVMPSSEEELAAVLRFVHRENIPWLVVGNGSNLLVGDKGIRGVVIRMGECFSRSVWHGEEVEATAGMLLAAVALEAAERGLSGLEFARGIPGSVGGGIRMNAGAYGGNLGPLVTRVDGITYSGEAVSLNQDQVSFAYRESSLFDLDAVVTKVRFRLTPGDTEEIMATMKDYLQRRSYAQPLEYPSCGSVFRNPPGDHAGHLVEMAGLRGTRCGDMEVSQKHGNFIVNHGHGTAAEARELISLVQHTVYEMSGLSLQPEVRFVGEF